MSGNLDLAPPPKTVDGLFAVPVDFQQLTARLRFDATLQSCEVDCTVRFELGDSAGCPIFDLRQTIGAAWLDGTAVAPAKLAHHDFGGGPDAELRVLEQALAAGSTHDLRLVYTLGLPAAPSSSSGPPTYSWTSGKLDLEFWYTDLQPGRYLDAWLPGNLLFDQFSSRLDVELLNAATSHELFTNGSLTAVATNSWRVEFPASWTVCCGWLRIHPAGQTTSRVGSVTLPGGATVEIRTHKPAGSSVDLAAQESLIANLLTANQTAAGGYSHGGRFTAFFEGPGGMEYAGACRTSTGALGHEVFHSWWGRGVLPASQNDGWLDEAWTVYVTGGAGPSPFSFADPPVELHSLNPWRRRTPSASYFSGREFFQGVASRIGDGQLRSLMRGYHDGHLERPTTTLELESHLLAAAGDPGLVDCFHRFVYGFANPSPQPDLWLRDDPGHGGAESWGGRFWDSPDLWVRHQPDGASAHQEPRAGADNTFYARVRNRGGKARHFMVTFNVKQFAGTQFVYPGDFLPAVAATGGFELGAGETRVVHARWPQALVPPAGTATCLIAAVLARGDHPTAGKQVWKDNNLAQKNLTVISVAPDGWLVLPVVVGELWSRSRIANLELLRPRGFSRLRASLLIPRRRRRAAALDQAVVTEIERSFDSLETPMKVWTESRPSRWAERCFEGASRRRFAPRRRARWRVESKAGFPVLLGLRLRVPARAEPGSELLVDLVERDRWNRIVGGVAVQIHVADR